MVAPLYNVDPVGQHTYGLAHPFPTPQAGTIAYNGTVTASSTATVIKITSQSGAGALSVVGLNLRFLDGPCAGQSRRIASVQADGVTVETAFSATPANTNSFVIEFPTPCNAVYVGPSTTVSIDVDVAPGALGATTAQFSVTTGAAQSLWLPIKARRVFPTAGTTAVAFW
jgi:hypothetical protein